MCSPTVITSRNLFSTVISGGNVFVTITNKREAVPDKTSRNVLSTVITSGNVFPTVITSRSVWNALCMYLNKKHVLRQQGGSTTKKRANVF